MEVALSREYTKILKEQVTDLLVNIVKYEAQKLAPPQRYFTKTQLKKFLKIGDDKFNVLRQKGLKVIIIGQQKHLYDIEDVYRIFEELKR